MPGVLEQARQVVGKHWFSSICVGAFVLGAFGIIAIDWPSLAALALGGLPVLLPLVRQHIKSVGPTGILTRDLDAVDVEKSRPAPDTFDALSLEAQRVLSALWHFQRRNFGTDSDKRWGFAVGTEAPDYSNFSRGASELRLHSLAMVNDKGFVFLTNEGIAFCKRLGEKIPDSTYYVESTGTGS